MSSSKAKRSAGLQGQRPQPLSLSTRPSKKPRVGGGGAPARPVIVYERPPTVIHAGPDEFMTVVQRFTGQQLSSSLTSTAATLPEPKATSGAGDEDGTSTSTSAAAEDSVLVRGQQRQHPPCGDDHPGPSTSPAGCCVVTLVPEQLRLLSGHDAGHTRAHQLSSSLFASAS